jgi:hypothetical protein
VIDVKISNPALPGAGTRERSFRDVEAQDCGMFLTGVIQAAVDNKGKLEIVVDCRS